MVRHPNQTSDDRKPVRVLATLTSLDASTGGIAVVNRSVCRSLLQPAANCAPSELEVVSLHDRVPDLPRGYGIDGRGAGGRFLKPEGAGGVRWLFAADVLRAAWRRRPELVYVDHLHLAVVARRLRPIHRAPYVVSCNLIEFDDRLSAERVEAVRQADMLVAISEATAERVSRVVPGTRPLVCHPALDDILRTAPPLPRLPPVPDAAGRPREVGTRAALIVGRLSAGERYKGHDQLIAAMPRVRAVVPGAQLVVAGKGDDLARLRQAAVAAGVGDCVLFTGFASGELLSTLFRDCRLFAMPSKGEGFGLVYLEAMQHGKPCIASPFDAGKEIVLDGRTGLLADPDDVGALGHAMIRLMSDDGLCRSLGEAGRRRVDEHFRFPAYRRRLRSHLAKLVPRLAEPD